MTPPDLFPAGEPAFDPDLFSDRRDTGVAFAWVAGLITLALVVGAIVWLSLDRAVPVAPIVEMRR